eukprot:gene872-15776_t
MSIPEDGEGGSALNDTSTARVWGAAPAAQARRCRQADPNAGGADGGGSPGQCA